MFENRHKSTHFPLGVSHPCFSDMVDAPTCDGCRAVIPSGFISISSVEVSGLLHDAENRRFQDDVVGGDVTVGTGSVLTLTNVQLSDQGYYYCVVGSVVVPA